LPLDSLASLQLENLTLSWALELQHDDTTAAETRRAAQEEDEEEHGETEGVQVQQQEQTGKDRAGSAALPLRDQGTLKRRRSPGIPPDDDVGERVRPSSPAHRRRQRKVQAAPEERRTKEFWPPGSSGKVEEALASELTRTAQLTSEQVKSVMADALSEELALEQLDLAILRHSLKALVRHAEQACLAPESHRQVATAWGLLSQVQQERFLRFVLDNETAVYQFLTAYAMDQHMDEGGSRAAECLSEPPPPPAAASEAPASGGSTAEVRIEDEELERAFATFTFQNDNYRVLLEHGERQKPKRALTEEGRWP